MTQPSITGMTHTLPFDRLSPRDFERLCLWLIERKGYERAEHLGAAGSEQGCDIIAWREGELWAFQCKRVQNFYPKDALAEVDKVQSLRGDQRPVGMVFLVTCDVSANARQQARERAHESEIACHFWTGTELDAKVKRYPDIVEEFFQTPLTVEPKDPHDDDLLEKATPLSWRWWRFYLKHTVRWIQLWGAELSCGYGEKPLRPIWWALTTILIFPFLYWAFGGIQANGSPPTWVDYLNYSFGAFTTIGFARFETTSWMAETLTGLEALLGISILALLMFALGNRMSRS